MYRYFQKSFGVGSGDYIYFWKSGGLSDESINSPITSEYSLTPKLSYFGTETRVEFNGSCLKQDKITYTHGNIVNIYKKKVSKSSPKSSPTLGNSMFGAVKLTKNADIDKYKYYGYGTGFDRKATFSFDNGFGRYIIIFGVDMSSSLHVDNKKKDILILGEGPTQGLFGTKFTAEKKCPLNFTKNNKKSCLSLHYNRANSYLFVNGMGIIKYKAKDSEIGTIPLCVRNISTVFLLDNMKKTGLNGYIYDFSVDYNFIEVDDILDIHKYLMKKNNII